MNVFCPYTELERATKRALHGTHPTFVHLVGGDSMYYHYFETRWAEGHTFINVEHDVVPWPGALAELWACKEPWCAYAYEPEADITTDSWSVPMGCVKFDASFIRGLQDAWSVLEDHHWSRLDSHLTTYARAYGYNVHQHRPAVLNVGQHYRMQFPE